jgi:hypothetical protein
MLPRRQVFTGILVTRYSPCNLRTHSVATVYIILLQVVSKSKQVSRKWERWTYCFCLVIVSRHRYFKIVFSLCKLPYHVVNHIKSTFVRMVESRNRHKRPYCYSTLPPAKQEAETMRVKDFRHLKLIQEYPWIRACSKPISK